MRLRFPHPVWCIGLVLLGCTSLTTPPDWAVYGPETRVLVVASPSQSHPDLKQQKAALEGRRQQWQVLNLAAVVLLPDNQQPLLGDAPGERSISTELRQELELPKNAFAVLLLDENSQPLIRTRRPLSSEALVALLTRPRRRPAAPPAPVIRDWAHDR